MTNLQKGELMLRAIVVGALLPLFAIACDGNISLFGSPTQIQNEPAGATPTPTPKGSPSPSPTVNPCQAKAIVAALSGGTQPNELKVGEQKRLDATAKNDQGDIADGCNLARFPEWKSYSTTCAIVGSGWNPEVRGLAVGACLIRTCLKQPGDDECFLDPAARDLSKPAPVTSQPLELSVK